MNNRKKLLAATIIPVFLAVLACPALAATTGGKGSHYPGQDCKGCHKVQGNKGTENSTPSGAATGTGSGAVQPAPAAPKGASAR